MSAAMEKFFNLPDLGEGLTESEILSWKVAVGDTVELNQIIAEVETAKAIVELPSPFSGVVTKVFEPVGAVVNVGNPIISFEVQVPGGPAPAAPAPTAQAAPVPGEPAKRQPTLVGYGAAVETAGRPVRRGRTLPAAAGATVAAAAVPGIPESREPVEQPHAQGIGYLRARPPVRKLARDLHVDLSGLHPSGAGGLITREDVLRGTPQTEQVPAEATVRMVGQEPDAGGAGNERERRVPVHGVRKATANAVVASAFTAPHVSEFLSVDVTEAVELLDRLRRAPHLAGAKLTITTLVAKAVSMILGRHQGLNSRWDQQTGEIIEYSYVNLGIAAATERGLMVPVVHEAQSLDLLAMAGEIVELTRAARDGSISPAQLSGGTFSISNVGVFGIDSGTPILPPGQTGILALGQVRKLPWEYRDEVALRQVMTLSLSFDHRVVDGEQGAKFLAELGLLLNDPGMLIGLA